MFEYFLILIKIRFINFVRLGLHTAANLMLEAKFDKCKF